MGRIKILHSLYPRHVLLSHGVGSYFASHGRLDLMTKRSDKNTIRYLPASLSLWHGTLSAVRHVVES